MRWLTALAALVLAAGCGSQSPTAQPSPSDDADPISYEAIVGEWFGECIECKGSGRVWWVSVDVRQDEARTGEDVGTVAYGWLDRSLDDPLCSGDLRAREADPPEYLVQELITYVDEVDTCTSGSIRLVHHRGTESLDFVWSHPFLPDATAHLDRRD